MWDKLLSSDAAALVVSTIITGVVTAFVTVYTVKRSSRPVVKRQAGEDVYKAWIKSIRLEMDRLTEDFDLKVQKLQGRIDELEKELDASKQLGNRRLNKLLEISRRFNVDISDVV
jgi:predicted PurR-regulated permease PerM